MVSQEIIKRFKLLYQEEFNISLNDEEATQMTTDLVNLMGVILKREPKETVIKERGEDATITTRTT